MTLQDQLIELLEMRLRHLVFDVFITNSLFQRVSYMKRTTKEYQSNEVDKKGKKRLFFRILWSRSKKSQFLREKERRFNNKN